MNARASALKAPPYARDLIAAKRRGESLNLFVHAGDHAWQRAQRRAPPHVLCCPPDDEFKSFDWRCVSGLDLTLVIWNRDPEFVDAFARHLVRSGATLVAAIDGFDPALSAEEFPRTTLYKPAPLSAKAAA